MRCDIRVEPDYLKAELFDRHTPEETRDALAAIAAAAREHGCSHILISVRSSRPISQVELPRILEYFRELGGARQHKIPPTAASHGLRLSQQYFRSLTRGNRVKVRSPPHEQTGLD